MLILNVIKTRNLKSLVLIRFFYTIKTSKAFRNFFKKKMFLTLKYLTIYDITEDCSIQFHLKTNDFDEIKERILKKKFEIISVKILYINIKFLFLNIVKNILNLIRIHIYFLNQLLF